MWKWWVYCMPSNISVSFWCISSGVSLNEYTSVWHESAVTYTHQIKWTVDKDILYFLSLSRCLPSAFHCRLYAVQLSRVIIRQREKCVWWKIWCGRVSVCFIDNIEYDILYEANGTDIYMIVVGLANIQKRCISLYHLHSLLTATIVLNKLISYPGN